jgi:preprotein translocase subunit SecG
VAYGIEITTMMIVVLVVHVMIAATMIGVVLIQKSEGGGLGIGGGGGMSGFMTGRSTANLLTRTTAILFACFMGTSILLAVLHAREHGANGSIFDAIPVAPAEPAPPPQQPDPAVPLAK